jgi:hypothetical protein
VGSVTLGLSVSIPFATISFTGEGELSLESKVPTSYMAMISSYGEALMAEKMRPELQSEGDTQNYLADLHKKAHEAAVWSFAEFCMSGTFDRGK